MSTPSRGGRSQGISFRAERHAFAELTADIGSRLAIALPKRQPNESKTLRFRSDGASDAIRNGSESALGGPETAGRALGGARFAFFRAPRPCWQDSLPASEETLTS